jgi:exonuclease VII small subunit
MDKSKKSQAEKLQIKLDKHLQAREKKQQAYEKSKQELHAITKSIDSVKLKLFEILQSGSDDATFSNWAKRKINETGNSAKTEKPTAQNQQAPAGQNQNQRQ